MIICCFDHFNQMFISSKVHSCTHSQIEDIDILNALNYYIVTYYALLHVKLQIQKKSVKLLYILDYLLFRIF